MPFVTKLKKRYIQFTRKKQKRVILKDNMKRNNCNEIPRASLPLFSLFLSKRGVKENGHETQFCCENVSLELEVIFFFFCYCKAEKIVSCIFVSNTKGSSRNRKY